MAEQYLMCVVLYHTEFNRNRSGSSGFVPFGLTHVRDETDMIFKMHIKT